MHSLGLWTSARADIILKKKTLQEELVCRYNADVNMRQCMQVIYKKKRTLHARPHAGLDEQKTLQELFNEF